MEEHKSYFNWGIIIITFIFFIGLILITPTQAIVFGATPTPTPLPTPTAQIVYITVVVTPIPTPTPNATPTPIETVCSGNSCSSGGMEIHTVVKVDDQAGVIFIARGDEAIIGGKWDSLVNYNKLTSFWLFGTYSSLDYIYDQPIMVDAENNYHIYLNTAQTSSLKTGKYIGLVQFSGRDGRKVNYDFKTDELISPFRDVDPILVKGYTPGMVYQNLMSLLSNQTYNDDIYEIYDIRVEDPWINIYQNYDDGNIYDPELYVSGETNLGISNTLTITLDAEKQTNNKLMEEATRVLRISPYTNPMHPRNIWNFTFPTTGLYPGKHSLLIKSLKFGIETTTEFNLQEAWATATPTPPPIRIVGFPTTASTPTPIPPIIAPVVATPTQINVINTPLPTNQSYAVVSGQESWTVSPTPIPTAVPVIATTTAKKLMLNAKADSPIGKSLQGLPINPIIPVVSLIAGAFVITRKRER